jgi:hypothetical protein
MRGAASGRIGPAALNILTTAPRVTALPSDKTQFQTTDPDVGRDYPFECGPYSSVTVSRWGGALTSRARSRSPMHDRPRACADTLGVASARQEEEHQGFALSIINPRRGRRPGGRPCIIQGFLRPVLQPSTREQRRLHRLTQPTTSLEFARELQAANEAACVVRSFFGGLGVTKRSGANGAIRDDRSDTSTRNCSRSSPSARKSYRCPCSARLFAA